MDRATAVRLATTWCREHYHLTVPLIPAAVEQSSGDVWLVTLKTRTQLPAIMVAVSEAGVTPVADDEREIGDGQCEICGQPAALNGAGQQLCARHTAQLGAMIDKLEVSPQPKERPRTRVVGGGE